MKAYWFRGTVADDSYNNFGDYLTKWILEQYGHEVEWAKPEEAELFGCGSIIEAIPPWFTGTIYTTGAMHWQEHRPDLRKANILAVRGPLTAERIDIGLDVPYGDLGLLCRRFKRPQEKKYEIGCIPNYADKAVYGGAHYIKITSGIDSVISKTLMCKKVVTSSLHGLVLADAFGIKSMWTPSEYVLGGSYKFKDYAAALGEDIQPWEWRLGDQRKVETIVKDLEEMVGRLS
jgi:pyruvyltransferase